MDLAPDCARGFGSIGASSSSSRCLEDRRREEKNVTPVISGNSSRSASAQRDKSLLSGSVAQNAQASRRSSAASANSSISSTAAGQLNPPSSISRAITRLSSGELIG